MKNIKYKTINYDIGNYSSISSIVKILEEQKADMDESYIALEAYEDYDSCGNTFVHKSVNLVLMVPIAE